MKYFTLTIGLIALIAFYACVAFAVYYTQSPWAICACILAPNLRNLDSVNAELKRRGLDVDDHCCDDYPNCKEG